LIDIGWRDSRTPTYQPIGGEVEVREEEVPVVFRVLLVLAGILITVTAELTVGLAVRYCRKNGRALL
jgi:hypothetical protein